MATRVNRRNFVRSVGLGMAAPALRAAGAKSWYPEAGLGLFIHWGISSVAGKELSWSMFQDVGKAPPEQYYALADRFNPANYDPDRWLAAAAKAGFRYAVLTTRHHDGYSLWPSERGDFGTRQHLAGRDLLRPYVEACHKNGIKVGFYYSPTDWHFNPKGWPWRGFPLRDPRFRWRRSERAQGIPRYADFPLGEFQKCFEVFYDYVSGQVSELLTRYGKIDLLWFDGYDWPAGVEHHPLELDALVRRLQPGIVVNDRNMIWDVGRMLGDFSTEFEGHRPNARPRGVWEQSEAVCGTWSYAGPAAECRSAAYILGQLVRNRSWGGNFLVNFGPGPDGEMPPSFYQRCAELAAWMRHSGVSVYGVEAGPYPEQSDAPVTVAGDLWYVHFLPGERRMATLRGVKTPASARLLRTGQPVPWTRDGDRLTVSLPEESIGNTVEVIEFLWV